jgi:hypothetical protein
MQRVIYIARNPAESMTNKYHESIGSLHLLLQIQKSSTVLIKESHKISQISFKTESNKFLPQKLKSESFNFQQIFAVKILNL